MPRRRVSAIVQIALPILFFVVVHWFALRTWFHGDDFAWLGLRREQLQGRPLWSILFTPQAQGTVRPISERLYFLLLYSFFGLRLLPFRLVCVLTQAASCILLNRIARRFAKSDWAAVIAPVVWCAGASLAIPLGWCSAYNEVACAFFILLAFYLLLRFIETSQQRYWIAQFAVFLFGFGVLEIDVMYPALAIGYTLCCARRYVPKALWLLMPSLLFVAFHFMIVPHAAAGPYRLHLSGAMFSTLGKYWLYAISALTNRRTQWSPFWLNALVSGLITIAALVYAAIEARRRRYAPAFFLAWFVLLLLPVLPLRDHFTEYYLTVPTCGLALYAAYAFAHSRRTVVIPLLTAYAVLSIAEARRVEDFFYVRAREVEKDMTAMERMHQPNQTTALLENVPDDLFWFALVDDAPQLLGISHTYFAPGAPESVQQHPEWGTGFAKFTIPIGAAGAALSAHHAVVYNITPDGVSDITREYAAATLAATAQERRESFGSFVDVGDPTYQDHVGSGWYPITGSSRWMGRHATVQMGGPKTDGQFMQVSGYCPSVLLSNGPLHLTIAIDGRVAGSRAIAKPDQFSLNYAIPSGAAKKYKIDIALDLDRVSHIAPDTRELGLVFGTFAIR